MLVLTIMFIAKEGLKYLFVLMTVTIFSFAIWPPMAFFFFIGILFILLFFRDPKVKTPTSSHHVLSPASGRIREITPAKNPCTGLPSVRISIFLSIFDVHINRAPFEAKVEKIHYSPGRFFSALNPKAYIENENNLIALKSGSFIMSVRQIAGKFTRRIVCYCQEGQALKQGEKIGMIEFGSGTQIDLPPEIKLSVKVGQKVKAGETVLGILP